MDEFTYQWICLASLVVCQILLDQKPIVDKTICYVNINCSFL